MRIFTIIVELLLLILIALLYTEIRHHVVERILQEQGITFSKLEFVPPNCLIAQDFTYQHLPVAKRIDLCIDYRDLLRKQLHLTRLFLIQADLNTIQKLLKPKSGKSKKSEWSFLVDKARISAIYRYKGLNEAYLEARDINESFAKIEKLAIKSFAGNMDAAGTYQKRLRLRGFIHPKSSYIAHYIEPLDPTSLKRIDFSLVASDKEASFTLRTKAPHIYKSADANLSAKGHYLYGQKRLEADLTLEAHYLKSHLRSEATLTYRNKLAFKGDATVQNGDYNLSIEPGFYKMVAFHFIGNPSNIQIEGGNEHFHTNIELLGKKVRFSTSKIALSDLFTLPKELKRSWFSLQGEYDQKLSLKLDSDLAKGDIEFQDRKLQALLHPANNPILRLKALDPLKIQANVKEKTATLTSPLLRATIKIDPLHIDLYIAKSHWKIRKNEKIDLKAEIPSLQTLLQTLSKLYPIEVDRSIDAKVNLTASYNPKERTYTFALTSPYAAKKIENITKALQYLTIQGHGTPKELIIDYYAVAFKNHSFYATRPSRILFTKKGIEIASFWIEDSIKIRGNYKDRKGTFHIKAHDYVYSSVEGRLKADLDLKATLNGIDLLIEGNLKLKGGTITFKPPTTYSIQDPDIIVVDRPQKRPSRWFMNHLALDIKVDTQIPVLYTLTDFKILLAPDLLIWKEFQKELQLLGYIHIPSGLYNPLGEKYQITKSELYFYGKPTSPFLEIHIKTKKGRYTIYVTVTGTLDNPILHLDSDPYLPPKDILPLLLFNAKSSSLLLQAAGGGRLIGMFSNVFLKNMLSSLGIHLDTLTFTTNGSRLGFEIGKNIGNKITILYKNDEVSTIVIRYEINDHIQSEAIFGPDRSGIDLYYRKIR